jgi:valyl-tRNA synthetase
MQLNLSNHQFTYLKRLYRFLFVDDLLAAQTIPTRACEPTKRKLMRDLTRLTLFAYILLVLNPVMPVIADKIAHTFWEEYHIVVVHGMYGKYHVDTELNKAAKQVDKDKSAKSSQEEYSHLIVVTPKPVVPVIFVKMAYAEYHTYCPVSR